MLEAPTLGVDDNFLEYGGDSIVSIRVVGKARQAGWKVLPSQVFEHPTVSMLARVAEPWHEAAAAAVDGEPVPLTPVQRWFLQSATDVDRCCQTRLVELARPIEAGRLDAALRLVVSRHDALRLRFEHRDGAWRQSVAAAGTTPLLRVVDLSAVAPEAREELWGAARTACIDALGVCGPIVQAALMTAGPDTPAQLFIAVHHVAIDHLSWHVVLGELEAAVDAPDALGAPGLSFGAWAGYLVQRAAEGAFDADARAWLSANQQGADAEDAWISAADPRREVRRTVAVFDEAETAVILRGMHAAYNTQARDALLTALATALIEVGGGSAVRVALESNGRAPFADAIDITRTVGWFTAVSPLVVRVDLRESAVRRLVHVKDLLRRAPADATAFAAARLWSPDEALRRALSALPDPAVGFNYLGRVDGETDRRSLFQARPGSYGEERPTDGFCPHRVDVTAVVVNGRLVTEFLWSEPRDHGDTATNVTARYAAAMRALVEACVRGDGPGVTPSDFALVTLDESTLADLLDEIGLGDEAPS